MGLLEADQRNPDICLQLSILLLSKDTEVVSSDMIIGSNCDLRVRVTNHVPLSLHLLIDICCCCIYIHMDHFTMYLSPPACCILNHS